MMAGKMKNDPSKEEISGQTPQDGAADEGNGETSPVDKVVEEAVVWINNKSKTTIEKGSVEIGEYVLNEIFKGDIQQALSRNPRKQQSFSKICEHEDLHVDPRDLALWVRVAALDRLFDEKKLKLPGLTFSHKRELVKLSEQDDILILAQDAQMGGWSVRELRIEVQAMRGLKFPPDTGKILVQKLENSLPLLGDDLLLEFLEDPEKLKLDLSRVDRVRVLNSIKRLREDSGKFEKLVNKLDKDLMEIEGSGNRKSA